MNFPTPYGTGRAIINGAVETISWEPITHNCTRVTRVNGTTLEPSDYDDQHDFLYSPSDDGHIFYEVMVLLDPSEADPAHIPSADELKVDLMEDIAPVVSGVISGDIDSDDLAFVKNLFTIPECFYRHYEGDIRKARKKIIHDIWGY